MGFIASIQKKTGKKKTGGKKKSKTLKFKSDLQCGGCVSKVQPHLDAITLIESWDVQLHRPDKLLKVKTDREKAEEVARLVQEALGKEGYNAELPH
jgi:copper chaperone